jgi:hypothetical protein
MTAERSLRHFNWQEHIMAFSEYVLLVSLSAGIHAHADTAGIAIGPDVITQPNGGAAAAPTRVALKEAKFTKQSVSSPQTGGHGHVPTVRPPTVKFK